MICFLIRLYGILFIYNRTLFLHFTIVFNNKFIAQDYSLFALHNLFFYYVYFSTEILQSVSFCEDRWRYIHGRKGIGFYGKNI